MTLLELCNPLFRKICEVNRLARQGARPPLESVRAEITAILERIRETARETPGLLEKYQMIEGIDGRKGVELALIFFADSMIRESRLPDAAAQWQNIADDHDEFAGDEKFFDLLDEAMADRSPAAAEQLAVFYVCMGLGFTGALDQDEFNRRLQDCAARVRHLMDASDEKKICEEAYKFTDRRPLNLPPLERIMRRVAAFAVVLLLVFIVGGFMYHRAQQDLSQSLSQITRNTAAEAGRASGAQRP